jgi:hypothetical protein
MSVDHVRPISNAILYEGYLLYPYRMNALKNQRDRWMFGVLRPRGGDESSAQHSECIVRGHAATEIEILLRFLHPIADEAVAREVVIGPIALVELPIVRAFSFAPLAGTIEVDAVAVAGAYRLSVHVANTSEAGNDVQARSLVSTHVVIGVAGGELISLVDPPDDLRAQSEACRNIGAWPVLVGEPGTRHTALCAPIILPEYPEIAAESPGDLFDGLEIDEILSLRILTLTDEERARAAAADGRVAQLISRTEALTPDELGRLHGALRLRRDRPPARLHVGDVEVAPGDRVVLRPRVRSDIFDVALAGRMATVLSIEQDWDGRTYFTVTIDDDPGRDLGAEGKPGHRFFFGPDEVEPVR